MQVILNLENNQPSNCRDHLKFLSSAHLLGRNDAKTAQKVILLEWKFSFSNNPSWSVLSHVSTVPYHKRSIPSLAVVSFYPHVKKHQLKSLWKTLSLLGIWVLIWNVIWFFEWPGSFKLSFWGKECHILSKPCPIFPFRGLSIKPSVQKPICVAVHGANVRQFCWFKHSNF